jgi:uncharacterized protein
MITTAVLAVLIGLALGLLGGGGSTLAVPLLIYVAGQPDKVAIATSLLVVAVTSAIAAVSHARHGNVRWGGAATFAPSAMLGSYFGGHLALHIADWLLIGLFAVMMLLTAIAMWRGHSEQKPSIRTHTRSWLIPPIGFAVGLVTGLVGAGGGFLVVPALALVLGMTVRDAIGTSLVVIAANSGAALLGYLGHVNIEYRVAFIVTMAASAGAIIGSQMAPRIKAEALRRGFSILVLAMGVMLLTRALRPLLS